MSKFVVKKGGLYLADMTMATETWMAQPHQAKMFDSKAQAELHVYALRGGTVEEIVVMS